MQEQIEHMILITTKQAAEALGVCQKTIFNLMVDGQLPSVKIGTSRRFELSTIRKFIEDRRDASYQHERSALAFRILELEQAEAAQQGTATA